jgi:AcrR family transcriptional regulator
MRVPKPRLTAKLRKDSIAKSALPLFARKGLDGVTTTELAESCGVSEALIFRHFPTKEALFKEMLRRHLEYSEPKDGIFEREHSTATLVELIFGFVYRVVVKEATKDYQVMRLFYRSFVDDGEFAARFLRSNRLRSIRACFEGSLAEARKCGDALWLASEPSDLFWFVQHMASMACLVRLAPKRAVQYTKRVDAIVNEMVFFALRGIGLTDSALKLYATPERFADWRKASSQ